MGRTNPTYRDRLRRERRNWQAYERALRHRDEAAYDRLWEQARTYADAAGYANPGRTLDGILLSIALAQERRIADLESQLEDLHASDA